MVAGGTAAAQRRAEWAAREARGCKCTFNFDEDLSTHTNYAQVCYSFYVLSAMSILNKVSWIDGDKLTQFILSAQVGGGSSCTP